MNTAPDSKPYYKVGGSLARNAPSYVARKADQEFYEALKAREFCYVLNSRQMGKSSLRVQTMQRLQREGIACGVIDITSIGSHNISPAEWYLGIVRRLARSLGLKVKVIPWWHERQDLSPVQRLGEFIDEVILGSITQEIVIFIDEIDSILKVEFKDDFFALIRACYNYRADNPEYERLSFALLGVATPSDLIQDVNRTPFNIGRAIELQGFELEEARPLAVGLRTKAVNSQEVLQEILAWTGGQPFLTQKLCQLVVSAETFIDAGREAEVIEGLVRSQIINNWESQDEPEHLKTIRDRLFQDEQNLNRLLGLYQKILNQGSITANQTPEQIRLRLSGLVAEHGGQLAVYNGIYSAIFNQNWVNNALADLRPYAVSINAWLASDCQDESQLLRGEALKEAQQWSAGKSLGDRDYQFLSASQDLEQRNVEIALVAEREAKELLETANSKVKKRIRLGFVAMVLMLGVAVVIGVVAQENIQKAKSASQEANAAKKSTKLAEKQLKAANLDIASAQNELTKTKKQVKKINQQAQKRIKLAKQRRELAEKQAQQAQKNWQVAEAKQRQAESQVKQAKTQLSQAKINLNKVQQENQTAKQQTLVANQKLQQAEAAVTQAEQQLQDSEAEAKKAEIAFSQADKAYSEAQQRLAEAQEAITEAEVARELEQAAIYALRQFETEELEALVAAVKIGRELQELVGDPPLEEYPAVGPLQVLRSILANIREVNQFSGHQGWVKSASFSPDGHYLATAGDDGMVKIWHTSQGLIDEWQSGQDEVWRISFSSQGNELVTVGEDGTTKLWDVSGKLIREWEGEESSVISVDFSADGQYIAVGREDSKVIVWSRTGKEILRLEEAHSGGVVTSLSFHPQENKIITAGENGQAILWNLKGQKISEPFVLGKEKAIFSVDFSPDGRYLALAGENGQATLWNLATGKQVSLQGHRGLVLSISFSPDSQEVITGGEDGNVRFWDLSGEEIDEPFSIGKSLIFYADFSVDGDQIVTTDSDGKARLWLRHKRQFAQSELQFNTEQDGITSMDLTPDGKYLFTAGVDGTVKKWDLLGNQVSQFANEHRGTIWDIDVSLDGKYVATAGEDGIAIIWNHYGKKLYVVEGHSDWVTSVNFSSDRQYLVTASIDGTARLWNSFGELQTTLESQQGTIMKAIFSPDKKEIATVGDSLIIQFWSLSGQKVNSFEGDNNPLLALSFSKEGKYLATASADSTTVIWDSRTQEKSVTLRGHQGWVGSVNFSPNGKQVVTAGADSTVKLWNLFGQQIAELPGEMGKITDVNFSPDGKLIIAVSENSIVKTWNLEQLGFNRLFDESCEWLQDYLLAHSNSSKICQK